MSKRNPKSKKDPQAALDYNWAKDREFANEIMVGILEHFRLVKSQREGREEIWQKHYRQWSMDRTEADRNYDGRANLNVPQIRKEVETMTRRIYKGLLPEDYVQADTDDLANQDLVDLNTHLLRHYYDKKIKIKKVFMPWIKQGVIFGTSPIRQFWYKKSNNMWFRKRSPEVADNGEIVFKYGVVNEDVTVYDAPKLRSEDLFQTFVYPHNASTPDEIQIHFWKTMITRHRLQEKQKQGMCENFDLLKDNAEQMKADFAESLERLQQFGDPGTFYSPQQGTGFYESLEVWCDLILPDSKVPVPCVVEIINDAVPIRIQRNPYWHQQAPIDYMRFIHPPTGEFYGRGLPEAGESLQEQLNDTMNQTMDATTLALNNITIINPAYAPNSESFEVEPNAVWWADPNAVKQMTFPDLSDSGYRAAGSLRGMITEMSDNQPQLPDPIAGKARSTGQAQLAVSEWQTDLFTIIDLISIEAMNPLAFKTHSLIQQNIKEDDIIKISGHYAGTWIERIVRPEDIVGRYNFTWRAALEIENKAVKTQQLLNFMKVYQSLPPDAQAKIKFNWENFITLVLRDGFMMRDLHNIIETSAISSSIGPDIEEKVLKRGGAIKVRKSDDDQIHIQVHEMEQRKDQDPLTRAMRSKHITEHQKQARDKALEVQQIQMQMQALQAGQGQSGNPGTIPETTNQPDMERGMRLE